MVHCFSCTIGAMVPPGSVCACTIGAYPVCNITIKCKWCLPWYQIYISAGRPKKRGKTFTPLMFFEEITVTLQLKKGDLKF